MPQGRKALSRPPPPLLHPQPPQSGTSLEDQLLTAIAAGDDGLVMRLVGLLQTENKTPAPARSAVAGGTWRLVWSQQAEDANPLQVRACVCVCVLSD